MVALFFSSDFCDGAGEFFDPVFAMFLCGIGLGVDRSEIHVRFFMRVRCFVHRSFAGAKAQIISRWVERPG
jgi:hypothetical protein